MPSTAQPRASELDRNGRVGLSSPGRQVASRPLKLTLAGLAGVVLAVPVVVAASDRAGGGLKELQALHGRALDGSRGVAVSPDGKNVYVTAAGPAGGVAVFARDDAGKLSQLSGPAGCVTESGSGGKCTKARGVQGASSLAVSPDGKSVYVVSFNFAILSRNPKTGALTQLGGAQGCLGAVAGCGKAHGVVAGFVGSVTVSPDGKSVYVGSHRVGANANQEQRDDGAVAVFARSGSGALKQLSGTKGCISNGGFDGCDSASLLGTVGSLAVSPDGKNVYVGSETNSEDFPAPSAVLTYKRAGDGSLAPDGCIARTKRQGCSVYEAIFTPTSIAVSADGKNVYVTALQTHSVTFLSRGSGGELKPINCIGFSFAGCKENHNLFGPTSLAVTADGKNAYVTWEGGGPSAVSAFDRESGGALAFLPGKEACVGERPLSGTCTVGKGLEGAVAVATSPDGKNVYVAATRTSTLTAFARS
jgi:DNA-binding beta-propeller fold protein YncE